MTPVDTLFERDFGNIIKQTGDYTPKTRNSHISPSVIPNETPQEQVVLPRHFIIAKIFRPLVLFGRSIGICPLQIIQTGHSNNYQMHYKFRFLSLPFLYTLNQILFNFSGLLYWSLNTLIDMEGPFGLRIFHPQNQSKNWLSESLFNGSQVISIINQLTKLILPLGAWVLYTLQISDVPSFSNFLNNWSLFLSQFESAFNPYHTHTFYKTLKLRLLLFASIWTTPLFILLVSVRPINYFPGSPILGMLFAYMQIMFIVGTRALSYLRDMMILRTLTKAYQEIRAGMHAEYGNWGEQITKEQVRAWLDLITFTRSQAALAESYMSLPNLWSIFEVFISLLLMLSMSIFLFMNNALEGSGANFLPYTLIYTGFFTGSLFWKTKLAEEITEAEDEIAEDLIEMDTRDEDYETRLEMKLICDLIYKDPVKIRVGNMLTLNKRLLLAFFSQLAAYLVVILQFMK